jgi:hypothetical protein
MLVLAGWNTVHLIQLWRANTISRTSMIRDKWRGGHILDVKNRTTRTQVITPNGPR